MKILNCYSGIGGNRKLWGDEHEITAVEWDQATADVYASYFPNDTLIVGDAHQYLLDHYKEFDFIWSSPPCPSHSRINLSKTRAPEYPDMRLYEEIIFLQQWCEGLYCVENVIPYYDPLIQGRVIDKHIFWANFPIYYFKPSTSRKIRSDQIPQLQELTGFDLSEHKISEKRQKLRNCVHPEIGLHILNAAQGIQTKTEQGVLF